MKAIEKSVDRDRDYGFDIRIAVMLSLAAVIAAFLFVPEPEVKPYELRLAVDRPVTFLDDLPVAMVKDEPVPRHSAVPIPSPDGPATDSSVGRHNFNELHNSIVEPVVEPLQFWKVERKPQELHRVVPIYPEMARNAGIEGRVVVAVVIDTVGSVASATILASSGNSMLDAAALDAARGFRFTPAYQRDRPVPVQTSIPFSFRLE